MKVTGLSACGEISSSVCSLLKFSVVLFHACVSQPSRLWQRDKACCGWTGVLSDSCAGKHLIPAKGVVWEWTH